MDEHESALRATLITKTGISLDGVPFSLSLADATGVIQSELNNPGSILDRAINGEEALWDLNAQLMRRLIHAVEVNTWVAAGGEKSKARYPKPIPLPGEKEQTQESNLADGEGMDVDEAELRLMGKYE